MVIYAEIFFSNFLLFMSFRITQALSFKALFCWINVESWKHLLWKGGYFTADIQEKLVGVFSPFVITTIATS